MYNGYMLSNKERIKRRQDWLARCQTELEFHQAATKKQKDLIKKYKDRIKEHKDRIKELKGLTS